MGRLIVHIGTHKTATTSLQRHLARNREALAARGIWYPDYGLIGHEPHYAHLGIVNALAGQHEKFSVAERKPSSGRCWRGCPTTRPPSSAPSPSTATSPTAAPAWCRTEPERYWPLRRAYVAGVRELFARPRRRDRRGLPPPGRLRPLALPGAGQDHPLPRGLPRLPRRLLVPLRLSRPGPGLGGGLRRADGRCASRTGRRRRPGEGFGAALGLDLSGPETVPQQNVALHPDAVVLKRILHATRADKDAIRADIEAVLPAAVEPAHPPAQPKIRTARYADAAELTAASRPASPPTTPRSGARSSPRCPSRCFSPRLPRQACASATRCTRHFPGHAAAGAEARRRRGGTARPGGVIADSPASSRRPSPGGVTAATAPAARPASGSAPGVGRPALRGLPRCPPAPSAAAATSVGEMPERVQASPPTSASGRSRRSPRSASAAGAGPSARCGA